MSMMVSEEKTNQALISVLSTSNSQPSVPTNESLMLVLSARNIQTYATTLAVHDPPSSAVTASDVTGNPPIQAAISTLVQAYPETIAKLNSILRK